MNSSPQIVVAGASGYIGGALLPRLLEKFPTATITALSRGSGPSEDPRVRWVSCDLFSIKSIEEALPESVDIAYYLVHSMAPTAQLDQGSFADYDLILADNFARVIGRLNVQHLIYLGGLIPSSAQELSLHLQSRLEVEETFTQYLLPTTIFSRRSYLGAEGSSFKILVKLVRRLPVMICPKWTQNLTTPVDLDSVLFALVSCALDRKHLGQIYDLAGCRPLTYMNMMQATAEHLGLKRMFVGVSVFTPTLSRLWVSLVTGTSKALVYPLVESLTHEMVARPDHLYPGLATNREYIELLQSVPMTRPQKSKRVGFRAKRRTVRSIQRLPLPRGKSAEWVKDQYIHWLPRFLRPLIQVQVKQTEVSFCALGFRIPLLHLSISKERSRPDRQLLYITKGILVGEQNSGRLEFRTALNDRFVLAAIHDYRPALPWYFYRYTQAFLHGVVMRAFCQIPQAGVFADVPNSTN